MGPVGGRVDRVAVLGQGPVQQVPHLGFVLDHQDPHGDFLLPLGAVASDNPGR